jgi:hypothetical protein
MLCSLAFPMQRMIAHITECTITTCSTCPCCCSIFTLLYFHTHIMKGSEVNKLRLLISFYTFTSMQLNGAALCKLTLQNKKHIKPDPSLSVRSLSKRTSQMMRSSPSLLATPLNSFPGFCSEPSSTSYMTPSTLKLTIVSAHCCSWENVQQFEPNF